MTQLMNERGLILTGKSVKIGDYEVTLKKIQTFRGHDGAQGLSCDVYINGSKVCYMHDSAHGGCFEYTVNSCLKRVGDSWKKTPEGEKNRALWKGLEKAISELPKWKFPTSFGLKGKEREFQPDMDSIINEVHQSIQNQKDEKKGVIAKKDGEVYNIGWKKSIPAMIKQFGKTDIVKAVQKDYDEQKALGAEILNTEYLSSIGIAV